MLIKLRLENLALIEIIEINFEKGLNILTGDSGSGKSLILDSLNVLFGGSNIPLNHLIRPGKKNCLIEAKFYPSSFVNQWLTKNGFSNNSKELKIVRKSYKKNKKILTKYFLNDSSINKNLLKRLGFFLLDFAGQSDTLLFDSPEYRRSIIDDLGSKELEELNLKIKHSWNNFQLLKMSLEEKLELLRKEEENNLEKKQMFAMLDQANLNSSNEISELELKENKLTNDYEIKNSLRLLLNNLNNFSFEKQSISFLISQSIKFVNKISEFDIQINDFREKLFCIQNDVENLISEVQTYINQLEVNDISLEDVQNRLFTLKNLERTFLLELPQLIKKRDQLKISLTGIANKKEIKILELEIDKIQNDLNYLYLAQSSKRKKIAKQLQNSVMLILRNLGLGNANFLIDFEDTSPSSEGKDNINFLFSANPDQKLASLSKVISGGEMSRFLLAFKSSISKKPQTFFLDEIDNGLSGKSLFALVSLIKSISNEKQVLCITHQPFLAAAGKAHFKVKKIVKDGSTFTTISKLNTKKERQNELLELIGGGFGEVNDYASILLDRAAA